MIVVDGRRPEPRATNILPLAHALQPQRIHTRLSLTVHIPVPAHVPALNALLLRGLDARNPARLPVPLAKDLVLERVAVRFGAAAVLADGRGAGGGEGDEGRVGDADEADGRLCVVRADEDGDADEDEGELLYPRDA